MKKRLTANLVFLLAIAIQSTVFAAESEKSDEPSAEPSATSETKSIDETTPTKKNQSSETPGILGESVEIFSLRGENDVGDTSVPFPNRRTMAVDGGFDVSYEDQPPMIPHSIDKDRITLQENSCLKCHSRVDAKLENAPKPPSSHFRTRDGKHTKKIVAGRYFCTQCHAPQINTRALVKNTFKK